MHKDKEKPITLKKGEVLAFKTDTVWGFGVDPDDDSAIYNVYKIKKRDSDKPLILMSNRLEPLKKYIEFIPSYALDLIEKHLPGGLTLIFEKSKLLNPKVSQFQNTIGIRIPNSEDFSRLIERLNIDVLATTSCNISSQPPVGNFLEACQKFKSCATIIEPIKDSMNKNLPSTVILCEKEGFKVLRQGAVKLW